MASARHDGDLLASAGSQVLNVVRVAGQNPVTGAGNQHDGRIDGIIRTRLSQECAGIPSQLFVDWTYVYRLQKAGNAGLLASGAAPYLRDHDRARAQFMATELGNTQPRDH